MEAERPQKQHPKALYIFGLILVAAFGALLLWPVGVWPFEEGRMLPGPWRRSDLHTVETGLLMYTADYDGFAPDMADQAKFKFALMPYVKRDNNFYDHESKLAFVPNGLLSYSRICSASNMAEVVTVFAPLTERDGTRCIAFANDSARFVPENEFVLDLARTPKLPLAWKDDATHNHPLSEQKHH